MHENYMKLCLKLAKNGEGKVSPNPLVGAVVLGKNGEIAGEGWHEEYGKAHAEVNALNIAGGKAKGGTLYVNLEPCCHWGKTPPCTEKIINAGIKTLVVGMIDPNPKVHCKGLEEIKNAGIDVVEGVLKKECEKLNEIFIKKIITETSFLAIKTASSADGKIALSNGKSKWITSESAREEVHRLRNKYDAIMTSSRTVMADNPSLTARGEGYRNPIRIIIDSKLITSPQSKVYENNTSRTIIATSKNLIAGEKNNFPKHIEIIECPLNKNGKIKLDYLMEILYKEKIFSVLTEAGAVFNGTLVSEKLADKVYFFIAPKIIADKNALTSFEGNNLENLGDCIRFKFGDIKLFPPDIMIEGYFNEKN